MFFIFLIIFLIVLAIFLTIFSILMFHFWEYRLMDQDRTKQIIALFIAGGAVFLLLDFISFFNIPWELLNF